MKNKTTDGIIHAAMVLSPGDRLTLSDEDGRHLSGTVIEAREESGTFDRYTREVTQAGKKRNFSIQLPMDPEGGIITTEVLHDGRKADVTLLEVHE